jgi:hypothetical protein
MAPSATAELATPFSKVEVSKQPEKHARRTEDKTPLEAISHGPCNLVHPGTRFIPLSGGGSPSLCLLKL